MQSTTRTRTVVLLAIVLLLAGCGQPRVSKPSGPEEGLEEVWYITVPGYGMRVYKFIDREEGVKCYVSYRTLSCLPLEDTNAE